MRPRFTIMALLILAGMLVCIAVVRAEVTTEVRTGTVASVEGNHLVIHMSNGEYKSFDVPEDFRFTVDGKEVSVHELKPGTALSRTITTNTEPTTVYSTEVKHGLVWYVKPPQLIITGADKKNRQYTVPDWVVFKVDGKDMSVYDLKKGMFLTATIYSESQSTVVTTTPGGVSGSAPAAAAEPAAPTSEPSTSSASSGSTSMSSSSGHKKSLPKTGSPLAELLILGIGFLASSFGLRKFRK
jgi:LPXTG-motif cell wall-anchored protein